MGGDMQKEFTHEVRPCVLPRMPLFSLRVALCDLELRAGARFLVIYARYCSAR